LVYLEARNCTASANARRSRASLEPPLKHSVASHLIAGNVNLALVRQALGHRSINSTMQYVGTSDGQAAEAAQAALMNLY
jgi:site-specific recombinase XerD